MCVQTIIEEVAQIPWEIVPKDEDLRESPPEDVQAEIDEATYLLNNPNDNKGETINTIFRAAIRDSMEIDALSIVKGFSLNSYLQHPAGGFELKPRGQRQLVELFARDGGSFLKETDVNGIEYRYWQYCTPVDGGVIETNPAVKLVSEIREGERVLSADGGFHTVEATAKRQYEGKLLEIHCVGVPAIKCTPEHPFLVLCPEMCNTTSWIQAKDLKVDMRVISQTSLETRTNDWTQLVVYDASDPEWRWVTLYEEALEIARRENVRSRIISKRLGLNRDVVAGWLRGSHKPKYCGLPKYVEVTPSLMELVGYFLAEGSICEHQTTFTLATKEVHLADRICFLMRDVFSLEPTITTQGRTLHLSYSRKAVTQFFSRFYFGNVHKAHTKEIPDVLMFAPNIMQARLLHAYWLGDGHKFKTGFSAVTVSEKLAWQLRTLLLRLSIYPSLHVNNKPQDLIQGRKVKRHTEYSLIVKGKYAALLAKIFNTTLNQERSRTNPVEEISMGQFAVPITKIIEKPFTGEVYSLQVNGTHSYSVNGIMTHNSYLHPAIAPIEFDVNEIVYGMRYPRSYSVYGWAEIQSMETVLNSLINSAFTNATMFQEYSVPSGVISFTGSEEDEQRLREYFRTEIKGRFHKVAVLSKEAKFTPLTYTNRDLEFIQGQQWFAKIVWAIYKLTPSELGFTDDIRATGKAMSAQGMVQTRKAILPILRLLEQWMNNQIINEISDRIVFAFKYVDKQQEMADDQQDMQRITAGLMKINEYRQRKKLGEPVSWGELPLQITLAQMKAQTPKLFSPQGPRPVGSGSTADIPLSAEGRAIIQSFKTWGGVPNEGYDFAAGSLGGNDKYAAPILTYDGRTGQVKVLPQATMTIPGRRYITRDGQIFTVPARKPLPQKPANPHRTARSLKSGIPDLSGTIVKQYVKPTREPFIGPYEADKKPPAKVPSMVGGNPHETFRNSDLLPGEDPEEVRRSRDAVGPKPEGARARGNLAGDHDYPMGSLGYRPDEPIRDDDLSEDQTSEGVRESRVKIDYERAGKPFGPMEETQPHRTGPKESYRGGPGNVGGKYPRRQGGRIRRIGHPSPEPGPENTGEVWRETPKGKEKIDLHRGGGGVHKWERDETNTAIIVPGEEPGQTHIDPQLIRKPYPGRHRKVTGGGGYDVESRIVPTRAGTPKIIDGSVPHDDRVQKGYVATIPTSKKEVEKFKRERYQHMFNQERKEHPDFTDASIHKIVRDHIQKMRGKAYPRTTQPDNAPVAPLAQPRENVDPAGGAGTEQAPRIKPSPTIRRGPKYPRDVPPIQPDTVREEEGGAGAMPSTSPSGAKYVLQDSRGAPPATEPDGDTNTGSLGPDHRETLGYLERNLSKYHDDVKRSMWAMKKAAIQEFHGSNTHLFDPKGREAFTAQMVKSGYVELPSFATADLTRGHWCATCPAMIRMKESLTGYCCQKFTFPDRPHGCCNAWEPKPGVKQVNAYTAKEEWKGGRLETHLARPPSKRDIQAALNKDASTKTIDPKHVHSDAYDGTEQAERGLARKLTSIAKQYKTGKMSRNQAMQKGLKAIDENLTRMKEIARRQAGRMVGKKVTELAPEVHRRYAMLRKTAVEDLERILGDAKTISQKGWVTLEGGRHVFIEDKPITWSTREYFSPHNPAGPDTAEIKDSSWSGPKTSDRDFADANGDWIQEGDSYYVNTVTGHVPLNASGDYIRKLTFCPGCYDERKKVGW